MYDIDTYGVVITVGVVFASRRDPAYEVPRLAALAAEVPVL
jgi:hypothetical protein